MAILNPDEQIDHATEAPPARSPARLAPFGDRVLVKQDAEGADRTGGLIQIPESQQEPPLEGLVLKVGRGRYEYGQLIPTEARPGDHVLFAKYAGTPLWIDGEEYLLLRDEEILGIRVRADAATLQKQKLE